MTNVVQYDSNFNLSIGSSTSSSFNSSGSIIAASGFTGSLSGSVFGLGNTVSFSSSVSSDLVNLESKSASVDISITNINSVTSSNIARLSNLESKSSSVDISITNINSFTASNGNQSLNQLTGSLATTGSNTFYGTQVFSGSVFIATDLIVQGSSSIQYISASSVSIGTNIVNLNTATPSVRYAGISVQDSGSSAGITGSMLWDSLCNRWIYSNPSTIGYSGGLLMSGPRAATLGSETTLTCNYIAKSGGGDHLYDSCIIDDGTTVCVNANLKGSGTISGTCIIASSKIVVGGTSGDIGADLLRVKGTIITDNNAGYLGYSSAGNRFDLAKISSGDEIVLGASNSPGAVTLISGTGQDLILRSNGTCERMRITSCGNVGIGINNPGAKLQVKTTTSVGATDAFYIENTSLALFGVRDDGLIYMKGNVGIGTTTPSDILHIEKCQAGGMGMIIRNACAATSNTSMCSLISLQLVGAGQSGQIGVNLIAGKEGDYSSAGVRNAFFAIQTACGDNLYERMRITSGGITCFANSVCVPTLRATNIDISAGSSAAFSFGVDQQSTFAFGGLNGRRVAIIRDGTCADNGLQFGYDVVDKTGVIAGAATAAGVGIDFYTYNGSAWGNRIRLTKDGLTCFSSTICTPKIGYNGYGGITAHDLVGHFASDTTIATVTDFTAYTRVSAHIEWVANYALAGTNMTMGYTITDTRRGNSNTMWVNCACTILAYGDIPVNPTFSWNNGVLTAYVPGSTGLSARFRIMTYVGTLTANI